MLQFYFRVCHKGCIISIQQFLHTNVHTFRFGSQTTRIEKITILSCVQPYSFSRLVLLGDFQDRSQKQGKEGRSQHASLLHTACYWKGIRQLSSNQNMHPHVFMKQLDDIDEFVWAAVLPKDLPQSFERDTNEGLSKIYEADVQWNILFSALLLNLAV